MIFCVFRRRLFSAKVEAVAGQVEAVAGQVEAVAGQVEAVAGQVEAVAGQEDSIHICFGLCGNPGKLSSVSIFTGCVFYTEQILKINQLIRVLNAQVDYRGSGSDF